MTLVVDNSFTNRRRSCLRGPTCHMRVENILFKRHFIRKLTYLLTYIIKIANIPYIYYDIFEDYKFDNVIKNCHGVDEVLSR